MFYEISQENNEVGPEDKGTRLVAEPTILRSEGGKWFVEWAETNEDFGDPKKRTREEFSSEEEARKRLKRIREQLGFSTEEPNM